jgi:hypothetical protein
VDLCGEPAWMAAMIRKYGDVGLEHRPLISLAGSD